MGHAFFVMLNDLLNVYVLKQNFELKLPKVGEIHTHTLSENHDNFLSKCK